MKLAVFVAAAAIRGAVIALGIPLWIILSYAASLLHDLAALATAAVGRLESRTP